MSGVIKKIITSNRTGWLLFAIGFIFCITIWAGVVWGDFEASLFATTLPADEPLSTLTCPVFVSKHETEQVHMQFTNHTDRALSTNVRTYISQGYVSNIAEIDTPLKLQPGETKSLEWSIDPSEAVWGRLIMVRIYTLRRYPTPSYTGACGILVVDILGIPGKYLMIIALIVSLGALLSGFYIFRKEARSKKNLSSNTLPILTALIAVTVVGLGIGLMGNWLPSFLFLLLAILMTFILLTNKIRGT